MSDNPSLLQLYRDLVITQVLSPEEFWQQHASQYTQKQNNQKQEVGVSGAFLVSFFCAFHVVIAAAIFPLRSYLLQVKLFLVPINYLHLCCGKFRGFQIWVLSILSFCLLGSKVHLYDLINNCIKMFPTLFPYGVKNLLNTVKTTTY